MPPLPLHAGTSAQDKLSGIVRRVTFHSAETGWSVLKVNPFNRQMDEVAVTVHQSKVFAGATMDFFGEWVNHPVYGRQFKASRVEERKPATTNALEKYLGSGLIKGVGPKTARKIVKHFGKETLDIFDKHIARLTEVPGIAEGKLKSIQQAWLEHQEIRNVMMFLQSHGISTLFAVKIYKTYGEKAIELVQDNPYRLARDIYGIGFLSADRVALSLGLARDSSARVQAGIKHVLQNAREEGHCYLSRKQILSATQELLELMDEDRISEELWLMERADELKTRVILREAGEEETVFYAHSLYFDEDYVARRAREMSRDTLEVDQARIADWLKRYCERYEIQLSEEQQRSVQYLSNQRLGILTGGPGCGKTTTTRVMVALLKAMRREVLLAAPTGRAAQRMSEVIGEEAKTIHRLLEWDPSKGGFKRNEEHPLACDFLIIDECSMLDIHLAASVFRAVPPRAQLLLIGDADQLPSVGAGNVFKDLIDSGVVEVARLTQIFRQAQASRIIACAHEINRGRLPRIDSPFRKPGLWQEGEDCLFIDSEQATQEQLRFISKVKRFERQEDSTLNIAAEEQGGYGGQPAALQIPDKFLHVDIDKLNAAHTHTEELQEVLKRVPAYSSLRWGYAALEMVEKLYSEIIPKYLGADTEIQVLSPMSKGSLGTQRLNELIQQKVNPSLPGLAQLQIGGRLFRLGDRVIQRRNNYDLHVFNGDIGRIVGIDHEELSCQIAFSAGQEVREVSYAKEQLQEIELAYAITIHKSQGSEFEAVIIPLLSQHYNMLFRNLIYTGLTRARKLAIFVGSRYALNKAILQENNKHRQTALASLIREDANQ